MNKHTSGNWIVVGTHVERHDGDGIYSRIAACHDGMLCKEHGGTALANARLIAAAPELHADLYRLRDDVCALLNYEGINLSVGMRRRLERALEETSVSMERVDGHA
jgi:hypothetical protein